MNRKAFSLLETLVSISVGAFMIGITAMALMNVTKIFRTTSGRDAALRDLARARQLIQRDLQQGTFARGGQPHLQISQAPASLGGGVDSDVLQLLSCVNGTEIESLNDGSGSPYYFQNVIFYLTVPLNHDSIYGQSCQGGNDGGYDYNCPHKCLLRVVQDENPAFDHTSSTQDQLITPLTPLLTRPMGFPKSAARQAVSINLLGFEVVRDLGEVRCTLRAVSLPDAKKKVAVGSVSLRNSPFTVEQQFSVFPRN